jgi:tetratricopeptide (TPR) repeat protein
MFALEAGAPLDLLERARALQKQGALQEAQKAFDSAIPRLQKTGDNISLARALTESSKVAVALGDYDTAIRRSGEARRIHRQLEDEEGETDDLNAIGLAHTYQGNYAAAAASYEQALQLDRKRGDAQGEIIRLYNIGNVYVYQGRYSDAFRKYEDALERANATAGEKWNPRLRLIAEANLANLYQRLGRYQRALDLYLNLQAGLTAISASERGRLLANLGTLYRRLGDPVKALETFRTAQRFFAQEKHRDGEISVLKNIGIVLALDLHRLPEALEAFTAAWKLARDSSNAQLAPTRLYLGETLRQMNQPEAARRQFEAALGLAKQIGSKEYTWRALYGLGQLEEACGRTGVH